MPSWSVSLENEADLCTAGLRVEMGQRETQLPDAYITFTRPLYSEIASGMCELYLEATISIHLDK